LRIRNAFQHPPIVGRKAQRLEHEERHIGVARGLGGTAVDRAVQHAFGARLLAGRIHEHVLAAGLGDDAGDEMAGGLRPGRHDR
jgi:hypothetical protein